MTVSFAAVFAAGLLTALSPCVLPVAPILVAGLVGTDHATRWARLRATAWFSLGFAVVFVLLGLGVPMIATAVGPLRPVLLVLAAAALVLYGLKMMRVLRVSRRFSWMDRSVGMTSAQTQRTGGLQGLMLGAIFGLTWTPCAGPILGGVLTYVAAREAAGPGALMLLIYAVGVATPLLMVAAASEYATPLLRALRTHVRKIEFASGLSLVTVGALILGQTALRAGGPQSTGTAIPGIEQSGASVPLASGGVRQLVFFHSEHCPACRAMEAYLPALERDCGGDRWALVKIDVDRAENATAMERFSVRAVPTVSLLDARGEEVVHLVGYQSEARLRQAVEHGIEVACASVDSAPPWVPGAREPTCTIGKAC